ncbi:hypothetical protein BDZ91DRAFT_145362 [Kalaharituber pfeilii]|nr:hypothetical protein BDZ91DRAFT_145362 [Kalaharituber pfeilii]
MQIKLTSKFILATVFLGIASAGCTAPDAKNNFPGGPFDASFAIGEITPGQVLRFAPESTCANPQFGAEECTKSEIVAGRLNEAFAKFGLTTLGQKAGLASYEAFESVGFSANINHSQNNPGQGTKSMFMFHVLYNFALSFPELHPQVVNLSGGTVKEVQWDTYQKLFSAEQMNQIRALVLPDQYTFQSAPWLYSTNCDKNMLNKGFEGFKNFMGSGCIYADINDVRKKKWCQAVEALKPQNMGMPAECS